MNEREIFIEVIQRQNPAVRQAYLERACGDDDHLRRRVENLISAFDQAESFLQEPSALSVAIREPSSFPRPSSIGEESSGSFIGPYRLLEPIGEGGMGTVFSAEQSHPVRRNVALKVIKPGMDTKQVIVRFEAERQALALMDHPNIARVLDAGATDSGRPYFVMELVPGVPITDYCNRERLSITGRLELFVLVCRAVQHAHQKGVIHRDIKPSNILVTVVDGAPVPKVIDFGVAKATGPSLTEQTLITGLHHFVGTPLYMSPEQAELSRVDVDTRSDVYSLGVLLFELLTGTTPFDSKTMKGASLDEVRRIVREVEPPAPSERLKEQGSSLSTILMDRQADARRLIHTVQGELDWIVMKALEKDRTRRYESPSELAADVMRHLTDQPVKACPPSRLYHFQKAVRRHRGRITALGLIGSLMLGLAFAVGWQSMDRAARRAETGRAATRTLDEADRAMEQSRWSDARVAVSQAETLIASEGGDALRSRCRRLREDLTLIGGLDQARQQMSAVKDDHFDIGLADRLYGEAFRGYGIDVDLLNPEQIAGRMSSNSSVREEMIAGLDDWMRLRRGMQGKDEADWRRLLAAARAADSDSWRNRVRDAWEKSDRNALGDLATWTPFDRLHPCDVLVLEANLEDDRAVAVLRKAQQRKPDDFWINHALGVRLHAMQPPRLEEAIGYLRTASALRPESAGAVLNLGHLLHQADRAEEAVAAFEQAIRLKPDYATAYNNLGSALIDLERFVEAVRACREATRLASGSSAAHGNLGRALTETGEFDEAIAAFRESLRLEPRASQAARYLAVAHFKKVVADLHTLYRAIDRSLDRYQYSRCFLNSLLDPRSSAMLRRGFVLNLVIAVVSAMPALAGTPRYIFTRFDVPGANYTIGNGLNNNGTIVGAAGVVNGITHGFYWSGGVFTQVDFPGATTSGLWTINDTGVGVGRYDAPVAGQSQGHGFVFDGANFVSVDVPGSILTVTRGINDSGDVVGLFRIAAGKTYGFLMSGGVFTTIEFPGASYTACSGINENGQIVGDYNDAAGKTHGFLLTGGRFTALNYPKATLTRTVKINVAGQIVGHYNSSDGKLHGFLLSGGSNTTIDFPNAASTRVDDINDAGQIVGSITDTAGTSHGFYAVKQ